MNKNNITEFELGKVILINKNLNWTSFDVVNKIRNTIKKKFDIKKIKVGHAGTLDPLATGLVIVCTGKKTKEIEKFQAQEKEYIADIFLGETTPSFDLETEPDKFYPTQHITKELVATAIEKFIGKQEQTAPAFSAKKINGERSYISARKGIEQEIKPSQIEIYNIEILNINLPSEIKIKVNCSKGTYIRALARDIGISLNSGAYLKALHRTKIGNFSVDDALKLEEFEKML